ncbi:MAG: hypothetical protein KDI46_04795 [Alphaproteobacteria bacterium]|nr:hypothetical protein [Alphaproteobacteria bacterium]
MSMNKYKALSVICVLFSLLYSSGAQAAPLFCLKAPGLSPQCHYDDARQCLKARKSIAKAYCTINEAEISLPRYSTGYFCLVTSQRLVQCHYSGFESCIHDAKSKNGVCVRSLKKPPPGKAFEWHIENND